MGESLEHCVKLLEENDSDVRDEARGALLNICRNILRSPNDDKLREIRLDAEVVVEKLLPAVGAMECLFEIGYVEDDERIFLPYDVPLTRLQRLSKMLSSIPENSPIIKNTEGDFEKKAFIKKIAQQFHDIMRYEDPNLQKKARSVIPILQLEIAAMTKMRELQKSFKLSGATESTSLQSETELIVKDLFLVELLHWFKHKFFKWFNTPICSICSTETICTNVVSSADPRCSNVEIYRCENCNIIIEFPRYSHPEPLLTLRRGRCGEWANVFTLLCRSLDYDARFIQDETDHVWTEIWSISNKRWVHVDPCEDIIDKPLMYEKGWKKKLTYIIAYSRDEVQDVTWRYTRDQEAVMKRRTICSEQTLIQMLRLLSEKRQNNVDYSQARREYVIKRNLLELADMLYIPNSQSQDSDEIYEERSSGSLAWRLARGEITQTDMKIKNHIWDISKYGKTFELRYNIVKDIYHIIHDNDTILERKSGWLEGINTTEGGIIRKVENDWKMVYLARSPQTERGLVRWTFEIRNPELCIDTFNLKAMSKVFHGANVSWEVEAISNDNKAVIIPVANCSSFHTEEVEKAVRKLNLTATLSGGEGQLAWQHAQLFRQSLEDTEEASMIICIRLAYCCKCCL